MVPISEAPKVISDKKASKAKAAAVIATASAPRGLERTATVAPRIAVVNPTKPVFSSPKALIPCVIFANFDVATQER